MLLNKRTLKDGIIHLVNNEKIRLYKNYLETLEFKKREFEFSTFVKVVVNQQLLNKASGTIYRRIYSFLDNRVIPGRFLKAKVAICENVGYPIRRSKI